MAIIVKNWDHFQHYKHRKPPWIRLYRDLLDDVTYRRLPLASRALAPDIWLLASEFEGGIVMLSDEEIAYRLRITEKELSSGLEPLISSGFMSRYQDASKMIAECKQDATPEKSRVEKSREETESGNGKLTLPEWLPLDEWLSFVEMRKKIKKPLTEYAKELAIKKLDKLRQQGHSVKGLLDDSVFHNWQGFYIPDGQTPTLPLEPAKTHSFSDELKKSSTSKGVVG